MFLCCIGFESTKKSGAHLDFFYLRMRLADRCEISWAQYYVLII